MKKPDIPKDDKARVQTLESLDILDSEAEERFDRITRMAMRLFAVPIALVSLVDENRQWFKSCMGLDAKETPRDISFCGHAILGDDVFTITNASKDDRFADNPLVTDDPNIRFYAGCPLAAANGHKLGTLCIIDRNPREFSAEDVTALKDLASMVEGELAALQLATLDELTGISNRRGFVSIAEHALCILARQKTPASLIFLDLDKFKPINDTFGHAEGDLALTVFADHMKQVFRNSDLYGRMGGDEFAVLLTNTPKQAAIEVVSRFRRSIGKYNRKANRGYDLSFSHGIVEFDPDKHTSVESLLADGDELMYRQKKKASNQRTA